MQEHTRPVLCLPVANVSFPIACSFILDSVPLFSKSLNVWIQSTIISDSCGCACRVVSCKAAMGGASSELSAQDPGAAPSERSVRAVW
jgi:hypothetical protein